MVLDHAHAGNHVIQEWLSNPGIEIELEATAIHGISTEVARDKGEESMLLLI